MNWRRNTGPRRLSRRSTRGTQKSAGCARTGWKSRVIGLTSRLKDELRCLWNQSPQDLSGSVFGLTDIKRSFGSARKEAGLEDVRFHDLRHVACTRLQQAGVSMVEGMRISGHTQASTFMRYVNTNEETARRAAAMLDESSK